jgi:D-serine deaminase-like pyridoxal phosphate-dependent protein
MKTGAKRTLELLDQQVGKPLADVETPVAVVDLAKLEANLSGLQSYCDEHAIALWPHTKTHKSPEIGLRQLELGAGGLTVAKTGEAQDFAEAGAPRLLVHYPPFGAAKWDRLAQVAGDVELSVAVDSLAPAEGLSAALVRRGTKANILVEMDVGLHRTGQQSAAGAVELAQALSKLPAFELVGISCYPGHFHGDTIPADLASANAVLEETRDAFDAAGLPTTRISGGSTPSRFMTHQTCVNELRAGTYALLDREDGNPDLSDCAITVEVTVISDSVAGQVVIDAGSKTFTSDDYGDGNHGAIVGWPGANLHTLNEEHGYVDVSSFDERPQLGDRLSVVPNHACGCVNMHDGLLAIRDGVVDHVIEVSARGLVR